MSMVRESKPWWASTSAEKALGMASQPLTTASPRFQIDRSVFARTSRSFDDDEVAVRRAQAQCPRLPILGRIVPAPGLLDGGELQHHHAPGLPAAFEFVDLSTAHEKLAAIFLEGRRHHRSILLVALRVLHVNVSDDLRGHWVLRGEMPHCRQPRRACQPLAPRLRRPGAYTPAIA